MSIVWHVQLAEKNNNLTFNNNVDWMPGHPPSNGQLRVSYQTAANEISMNRIVIIGSSGSGKSTLARQLGESLNLPVIHLDKHFWHPGWVGTPLQDWEEKVRQFAAGEMWIIDGNYRSTLDIRIQMASTIVFLDLPRWLCTWRATKRRFQYWHRQRPDIADGCQEKIFDPTFPRFIKWVWNYPNRARPNILKALRDLPADKKFVWLRTSKDVKKFAEQPQLWPVARGRLDGTADFFTTARFEG